MRRLAVAVDRIFCNMMYDLAHGGLTWHRSLMILLLWPPEPVSNMAIADRASRQRYIANVISISRPILKEDSTMLFNGRSKPEGLQGDAAVVLSTCFQLFFRLPFGVTNPLSRDILLARAFPWLSRELEILPSGIIIDTCKALETLQVELSTVHKDQWTTNVLGSVLSCAARRLVWRTTQGEEVDNPETAVYDLLRGAVYGGSRPSSSLYGNSGSWCGKDGAGGDSPLAEIMVLLGKEETMERVRAAQEAIWDHLEYKSLPKPDRKKRAPSVRK
jgi:hypothetical protein